MLISKNTVSSAALWALVVAMGPVSVHAGTPIYHQIPNVLEKAERSVSRGQSDRAIELLTGKVAGMPRAQFKSMGYELLCMAYYQKKDYFQAESLCNKAVSIGAPSWSLLNNRGVMRYKLARYGDALADFKRAASMMILTARSDQKRSIRRNVSSAYDRTKPS